MNDMIVREEPCIAVSPRFRKRVRFSGAQNCMVPCGFIFEKGIGTFPPACPAGTAANSN